MEPSIAPGDRENGRESERESVKRQTRQSHRKAQMRPTPPVRWAFGESMEQSHRLDEVPPAAGG